jgi:hypothetical protein
LWCKTHRDKYLYYTCWLTTFYRSQWQNTVTVYVGPDRKYFIVPKDKICNAAEFFKGAFCTSFKKAQELKCTCLKIAQPLFSLFFEWLNKGTIEGDRSQAPRYLITLLDLYIFAEKICINSTELADRTMDKIRDVCKDKNLLPTVTMFQKVFQETTEDSKLRLYCSLYIVFYLLKKLEKHDIRKKGIDTFRKAGSGDLHTIFDLCKDNEKLFERLIYGIYTKSYTKLAADPRYRDEEDPDDRCFFYSHGGGEGHNKDKRRHSGSGYISNEKEGD